MGKATGIGWCTATWNPWRGCKKISPGCANCYMFTEQRKYGRDPAVVVRSKTTFNDPLKWKDPELIFTCSWSDFFIDAADEFRREAFHVMWEADHHTYLVLTKRSERLLPYHLPSDIARTSHFWWGVSVEDRKHGIPRIADLQEVDNPNRFLSIEPLLEDVGELDLTGIAWGIVGGESGFKRREMPLPALESVVMQFDAAGIPLFVKQDSAFKSGQQGRIPDELFRQQMPAAFAKFVAGFA